MADTFTMVDHDDRRVAITRLAGPATDMPNRKRVEICLPDGVAQFKGEELARFLDECDDALAWLRL